MPQKWHFKTKLRLDAGNDLIGWLDAGNDPIGWLNAGNDLIGWLDAGNDLKTSII